MNKELKSINLQRDNNRIFLAVLFVLLFFGWCGMLVWILVEGVDLSNFEGLGLGTVNGVLVTILTLIFQFFFRKSGTISGGDDGKLDK